MFVKSYYQRSQHKKKYKIKKEDDIIDEIRFGIFDCHNGHIGEATMIWEDVFGSITPRLEIHDDGFQLFKSMPELFRKIAEFNELNVKPKDFRLFLEKNGFSNLSNEKIV